MADAQRSGLGERDIDQAITALKKGAYLLKYGRRGKPKFCPFQLSSDESTLIWYSGKEEKQLKLNQVSKIIPGQRTAIFQRYPRPEKEYQSFSLIYGDRSLDLICKDKDEAEVWFVGLKALITHGNYSRKWRIETRSESATSESPRSRSSPTITPFDPGPGNVQGVDIPSESAPQNRLGKAFSDIILYTATTKAPNETESASTNSLSALTAGCVDNTNRSSTSDTIRVSLSSAVSSSSQGSFLENFDALGDVFIWGEGIRGGMLGGGSLRMEDASASNMHAFLPKALESTVVLDVQNIAGGDRHAVLVNRQGEIFSWGEGSGGRLGHGTDVDVAHPKLIETLCGMNIELVACGECHTSVVTLHGDLYTWGDGTHHSDLLGHGSEAGHWIPKKVGGVLEGLHVSYIACGPWHTAVVISDGQLFTFGDGSFGVLGHGDRSSTNIPREVQALRGLRTKIVACGVWHTAAVVEITTEKSVSDDADESSYGRLFTWGDGDKGRLGHYDLEPRLYPVHVDALVDENICQVACGHDLTIALTTAGRVYTMGSTAYGQLGSPKANGEVPHLVEGKVGNSFVEEIACGSFHIAVLTSKSEVYTWGRGTHGQLGHGDNKDRSSPTLVNFLKDKQVKTVACGANFTAIICLHKWVPSADLAVCSGCRNPFGFRRKRHNCYNCGLVFCNACSSRKSLRASLAPNMNKPYRVCDDCFSKLKKAAESRGGKRTHKARSGNIQQKSNEVTDKEILGPKLRAQRSKLPPAESSTLAESWHQKQDGGQEPDTNLVFPLLDGNLQLSSSYLSKLSSLPIGSTNSVLPNFTPSRMFSIARLSSRISPTCAAEVTAIESNHVIGSLNQEISTLRAQVRELTSKSQHLEAELERKSQQLEEVTALASEEHEKCNSAKEVIKSLTAQLKETAKRHSEGLESDHNFSSLANPISSTQSMASAGNHSTGVLCPEIESNGNLEDHQSLCCGTKSQMERPQWVVQAEPGVFMTLSPLPGGYNELKRVRFSRKHFTEQQAEKWWAENGASVMELHNIQTA